MVKRAIIFQVYSETRGTYIRTENLILSAEAETCLHMFPTLKTLKNWKPNVSEKNLNVLIISS